MTITGRAPLVLVFGLAFGLFTVTGCLPGQGGTQGSNGQNDTESVTHGTNVNQSFTLGAANTQGTPLVFDWNCTNSIEDCDFQLSVTTDDMGPGVTDWANNNPTLSSQQEFTLSTAVVLMLDQSGHNYLDPEFDSALTSVVTPGMIDCQYQNGWVCNTDTSTHVGTGSVPSGSAMTVQVYYGPVASFVSGDDSTPIDVSQFTSSVDITMALAWQ